MLNLNRWKEQSAIIGIYLSLLFLLVFASLISKEFFTFRNLANMVLQAAPLGLVCIGQTFTVLTGGIDLSVGSVISLTSCLTTGMILGRESMVVPVVALVIGLGLFIGFLNGFVITRTGVHPFIATLGMMSIVQGAVLIYTKAPY